MTSLTKRLDAPALGALGCPSAAGCRCGDGAMRMPLARDPPLAQRLDAVVIDTETTGLDAAHARGSSQIGACRIRGAEPIESGNSRRSLIRACRSPPRPRPIHGISDADVRGAPSVCGGRAGDRRASQRELVVIGHSIGFDLAVLEARA